MQQESGKYSIILVWGSVPTKYILWKVGKWGGHVLVFVITIMGVFN